MIKLSRKRKIVGIALVVLLTGCVVVAVQMTHASKCRDIIGDGYFMGTDPEPVVIGNTCE